MITNPQSLKAKYLHRLKEKKHREDASLFLVEGINSISEALASGALDRVIYSQHIMTTKEGKALIRDLNAAKIVTEEASETVIRHISQVETPQWIVGSARIKQNDLSSLFAKNDPLIIIACGIQDPGNLGTMIRTADAVGAAGFVYTSGSVDPYNEKVVRATAGSIFHLNIIKYDDIIDLVASLKRRSVKVFSLAMTGEKSHFDAELVGSTAIIIGNEGAGLKEEVLRVSDEVVSIPMPGRSESLNAAISGAVVMYEALRQRGKNARTTG